MEPLKIRFSEKEAGDALKKTNLGGKLSDKEKQELKDVLMGKKGVRA